MNQVTGGGWKELPHSSAPKARGGSREDQPHARGQGRWPKGCPSQVGLFNLELKCLCMWWGRAGGPGISQAFQKARAHKYKPKTRHFLPAGIKSPHGFSCGQRGQRGELLSQTQLTAGSGKVLASSSAPFTVLCPPCHQRGWGSPPMRLGPFSSP